MTAPARAGFAERFRREVDPEGVLPPAERDRRAEQLMRAHMLRLSAASAAARRKTRTVGEMTGPGLGGSRDSGHPDTR